MCLLDKVVEWTAEHIRCTATSHRDHDNPLRAHGRLASACGIEYAAQAMAIHGALLSPEKGGPSRGGYLASVRSVELHVARLDTFAAPLSVAAERLSGSDNSILYLFTVHAEAQLLLAGRASVILDATALTH